MQITTIFLAVVILLTGCASGVQQLRKVDPGMTVDQVEDAMGRRDGFCNAHVSLYEKCDFFVIFKDGKVIETGAKDVRAVSPNMQLL